MITQKKKRNISDACELSQTISDFPGYAMLLGWSMKECMSYLSCQKDRRSFKLNGKK